MKKIVCSAIIGLSLFSVVTTSSLAFATKKAAIAQQLAEKVEKKQTTLDINAADIHALAKLKGIGKRRAAAIVAYRTKHGPFKSKEALTAIKGVTQALVEKLATQIHISV